MVADRRRSGDVVGMHRRVSGSDSNNEKTQKNMKIVMEENFIFSDRRFKHKFELSNLST